MDAFDNVGETRVSSYWGKTRKEGLITEVTPIDDNLVGHSLSEVTVAELRKFFATNGHHPSKQMWTALSELASVLERMAEGRCEPKMFLSSLDPGVGKTQTVIRFVEALMRSEAHKDVGVLICMSRLKEIDTIVKEMALADTDYAVLTSDRDLNKLGIGSGRANEARVLFTTQQMIEKRGEGGRHFAGMDEFHFLARPRQVRIWDESILPGQTATLNRYDMACLPRALTAGHYALATAIDAVCNELFSVEDGTIYQLPDFASRFDLDLNEALRFVSSTQPREPLQQALTALWLLSGKTASVRRDGRYGNTVLDYHETLPEGLAPLVVLDASGRVRSTYHQWEENRGGLVRLASAPKSYRNLTVHCWQRGGGKSAFRRDGQTLIEGIVKTINDKPEAEKWLVVHHKDCIHMEFRVEVEKRITGDKERVKFLHWGEHHATNEFSKIPNVILAGTLFYRPSYYEALARLVADRHPAQGAIEDAVEQDVMTGEHRHLVLQALCRGNVRRCQGAECASCNAYIIASVGSGIREALPQIFPDCQIVSWQPVHKKPLSGKVKEAAEFVIHWFQNNPDGLLRFSVVQKAIGMQPRDFRRNVRRHSDFEEALASQGITETTIGRGGFVKLDFDEARP